MNRWVPSSFAVLLLLASGTSAGIGQRPDCLKGFGRILAVGRFSGSTNCRTDRLTIRKIGMVRKSGHTYSIYDYRYRLKPACSDCAVHGGQRIVFMEGGRYIGQYKPDNTQVAIIRGGLMLSPDPAFGFGPPVAVHFTALGPPREVWFDGALLTLFR